MNHNWFGEGGQQLQQNWAQQPQQGWGLPAGQWTGQPHPQQTGLYGSQFQQFQSSGQAQLPFGGATGQQTRPPQAPGFLTQQAYAQEHERRVKEERKKLELEQQKKKLQSLSVAKQSHLNIDDLFERQLTEVPRHVKPTTAEPAEPQPSLSPARELQKQSGKALSWATEDFSGLFAQHSAGQQSAGQQSAGQQSVGSVSQPSNDADNFGDFQSSGFRQLENFPPPTAHMAYIQPGAHLAQPGAHMAQPGAHMAQPAAHMMQGSSQLIATSAYQQPLSSSNVLQGLQGSQPPASSSQRSFHATPPAMATHSFNLTKSGGFAPSNSAPNGPPQPTDPSTFHPLYHKVYRLCRQPEGGDLVSTQLLYPVLLSSKLPRAQLRDLWATANRGQPGQLSQIELFVLLGLVGLAQAGLENPSLEDLKRAPSVPVPTLPGLSALSPTSSISAASSPAPVGDGFGQFHSSMVLSSSSPLGSEPLQLQPPELAPAPAFSLSPTPLQTAASPDLPLTEEGTSNSDEFGDFTQFYSTTTATALLNSTSVPPPPLPATFVRPAPLPATFVRPALLTSNTVTASAMLPATAVTSAMLPATAVTAATPSHPLSVSLGANPEQLLDWADFTHFSFNQEPLVNGDQLPQISAANEEEPPTNQALEPQKSGEGSLSKSRVFDFQPSSSQPTIDDMERDLLSKLTPTLPRKSTPVRGDTPEKKEASPKLQSAKAVRKTVSEEEGWRLCLVKSAELLASCAEVFSEVKEKEVLEEIAQSKEAQRKLQGIAEVYRLSKRIYATLSTRYPQTATSVGEQVRNNWRELDSLLPGGTMEEVYQTSCPPLSEPAVDILSDTISQCALCLLGQTVTIPSALSLDSSPEHYSLSLLFHQGQSYHASCANFWRHLISEDAPVFQ